MVGGGRIGLAAHAPNLEAVCVLYRFFTRDGGGGDHGGPHCSWLAAGRLGEGRLLIGNSDKPFPEG